MVMLKKYNIEGKEIGEVTVEDAFLNVEVSQQLIKDYVVALRANRRQWSANTKGRGEVNHTTRKPFRQKGTGNARQGSLASPQYKGGGVVFGPKPKFNQHIRINRKQRRLAIRYVLAEKIKAESLFVVEDAAFDMKEPKTKIVANFLKKRELESKRILFVGEGEKQSTFKKSMQNIARSDFVIAPNVNGYIAMVAQKIVITESGLKQLKDLLQQESK